MNCQLCGSPWGVVINKGKHFNEVEQKIYCYQHLREVYSHLVKKDD